MKILIAEDEFSSRFLLQKFLEHYGTCYIAVNGKEVIETVKTAIDTGEPYDLICLDIMMPEMNGQDALEQIRLAEEERGILSSEGAKIIMTTALGDMKNIKQAFHNLCDDYLVKPISRHVLVEKLRTLKLVS